MTNQAYEFNKDAAYRVGSFYSREKQVNLLSLNIFVSSSASFATRFPDVFGKYKLPYVESDQLVQAWSSTPMQWWQNQVNFAVWCATSGCGVSAQDHLAAAEPLMQSVYQFHTYYQVRRILAEIGAALPQDQAWDAFKNLYNRRSYERICNEFGVDVNSDWRQKQSNNQGLGTVFNYWTRNGYHVVEDGAYHAEKMSFTQTTTNDVLHIDYIAQGSEADAAWTTFILDKSSGYTRPGVERINDSIRTYVWAILGAQGQTRTNILGTGLAFDAQKQFLVNVEGAISSPVDVPSSIERYQKVLQYAREKVDYVFGYDLYMSPGDMQLRIGKIEGYNNLIVTATKDMQLGSNTMVNATATPPTVVSARAGSLPAHHDPEPPQPNVPAVATTAAEVALANQHNDEKTALTVGLIVTGLFFLWYCGRPHHS